MSNESNSNESSGQNQVDAGGDFTRSMTDDTTNTSSTSNDGGESSFSESSSQGFLARLGNAVVGVLVGLVLAALSVPLLFWNEGRAVREYRALSEGGGAVQSAQADKVDPAFEGKLIHVSGKAKGNSALKDSVLAVSAPELSALSLRRTVEVFQWKEESSSETRKKLGGGTETVTNYKYTQAWSNSPVPSTGFKQPNGHSNPANWQLKSDSVNASEATLGAFKLTAAQVSNLGGGKPFPLTALPANLPEWMKDRTTVVDGALYVSVGGGRNPQSPEVGDTRIRFALVEATDASIVAKQQGASLVAYKASNGNTIELLQAGIQPAAAMFKQAESSNKIITWLIRAGGFILMWIGFGMLFKPLDILADIVPFVGSIVSAGTTFIAFILASVGSLVTAAVAWIFYRPLIGIALLALAGGAIYWLWQKRHPAKLKAA